MKSNRTHDYPPKIEDLGDGTFYYNFDVVESQTEEGDPNYSYHQVRCKYDESEVNVDRIKQCLTREGYGDHEIDLTGYEDIQ